MQIIWKPFVLLLLIPLWGIGQTSLSPYQLVLTADATGKYTFTKNELENLHHGDYYQVYVNGVNLYTHRVVINGVDSLVDEALSFPSISALPLDAVLKALANVNLDGLQAQQDIDTRTEGNSPNDLEYLNFDDDFTQEYNAGAGLPVPDIDAINHSLGRAKKKLLALTHELKILDNRFLKWQNDGTTKRIEAITSPTNAPSVASIFEIKNDYQQLQIDYVALRIKILSFQQEQDIFEFNLESSDLKKAKEARKNLLAAHATLLATVLAGETKLTHTTVLDMLQALAYVHVQGGNSYVSFPMRANGNRTRVNIQILPRDPKAPLNTYQASYVFPIDQMNYQGVGASVYVAGLYDEVFSKLTLVDGRDSLVDENPTQREVGTAVMLRLGRKTKSRSHCGWHLSAGVGLSLSNQPKPRLLGGGGVSWGLNNKHRFSLDLGGIGGMVERRSKLYPDSGVGTAITSENLTVARLQASFFIGFGYVYVL